MRQSHNGKLYDKLSSYIGEIIKIAKDARKSGKSIDVYDYPQVAVGCEYNNKIACGRSNHAHIDYKKNMPRSQFNPLVENKLKAILKDNNAKIPLVIRDLHNELLFFGTCAEDDAANKVLNTIGHKANPKLRHLKFTKAIRPRTGNRVTYCQICKQVFS